MDEGLAGDAIKKKPPVSELTGGSLQRFARAIRRS